jgi:hypothetical protein
MITANLIGYWIGEWKLTHAQDRRWMAIGLLVSLIAVLILAWSSTLG